MHLGGLTDLIFQSSSWLQVPFHSDAHNGMSSDFSWDDTASSKHFVWHPCFGDFQCAKLQVPMDWTGTTSEANQSVELAVIKVQATVPVSDPTYGGAVVLNPGGPGGSGVSQVLKGGHHVRTVLSAGPNANSTSAKNFDIIGFDPRGINNTRPLLTCYPDRIEAAISSLEEDAYGFFGSSDTSFDNLWASKRALAEGCSKRTAAEGIAKHMNTAPVARDIVEIFEEHGRWREAEASRLLGLSRPPNLLDLDSDTSAMLARTAWRKGNEVIQYWGFSYGSILGATLAAMYPERIHRAVLDGVANSHDYMAGGWTTNLFDTDLTFAKLAEHCWEGGAKNCPLYHPDGPAVIAENVGNTMQGLKEDPISVPAADERGPTLVTSNDVARLIREIVYWPVRDFPMFASILADLSQRNGTSLAAWIHSQRPPGLAEPLSRRCLSDGPYSAACFETKTGGGMSWDATYGVACSDAPGDRLNQSKASFREYADKLMAQSRLIGASWAAIQLPCTAWHARPAWRYQGNFHNKTAHPILFAGNTIDPVTPLRNAFLMAEGFDGAGVLHQDSEGHCTYSGLSFCSMKAIRRYFQSGTLPGSRGELADEGWDGVGKLCEVDRQPFDGYEPQGPVPPLPKGEDDEQLWEAMVALNRVWP